jgi:hypothetical protein
MDDIQPAIGPGRIPRSTVDTAMKPMVHHSLSIAGRRIRPPAESPATRNI